MFFYGFDQSYITWYWHGEAGSSSEPTTTKVECCTKNKFFNDVDCTIEVVKAAHDDFHADAKIFKKLLQDTEKPLYPSCRKFTKLSTLVNYTIRKHDMDGLIKAFWNY